MCLTMSPITRGAESDASILKRRNRLIETVEDKKAEALPALVEALKDDRETLRLTAAHLVVKLGEGARPGFEAALRSPDVEVRRVVIDGLADMGLVDQYWSLILRDDHPVISRHAQLVLMKEHSLPDGGKMDRLMDELKDMYLEGDAARRRHVVHILASFDELAPASRRVLKRATKDENADIRRNAYQVILDHVEPDWNGAAELLETALADPSENVRNIGKDMRWKLLEVKQVGLPKDGWRFRIDPDDVGREQGWYKLGFDDSEWRIDVPIESSWKAHMQEVYNGVGWYRRRLDIPEAPNGNRVYLHFEGVDEEAWVWVNGEYVGEHAIGKEGWNVPFVLDVTEAVKLGDKNQITVRAKNTSGGAGIWRPVHLRILNTDALKQP
jgi:hypothetical protein